MISSPLRVVAFHVLFNFLILWVLHLIFFEIQVS